MEEVWKDVKGYEGFYQVSNIGQVKSLKRKRKSQYGRMATVEERILSKQLDKHGYFCVILRKNNIIKKYFVHRLVAEAFIPNPQSLYTVNHKNEIKTDNRVENLEWLSLIDNLRYGSHDKNMARTQTNRADISKPVLQYSREGVFIAEYPSTKEVYRQTGYNFSYISNCCNGKIKSAYGYLWKWKSDEV